MEVLNLDSDYIEEYIKNLDLSITELESLGASLNAIGYLIIYYGSQKENYDVRINYETDVTPSELLLLGQYIIVIGYLILCFVGKKRFESNLLRVEYLDMQRNLSAYKLLERSYIISSFANFLRLEAFYEIFLEINSLNDEN